MTSRSPTAAKSLYRSLLRAHAKVLPPEMRQLGDAYVKSEFRLHRGVTKSEQLIQFFAEWEQYLSHIRSTAREQAVDSLESDSQKRRGEIEFGRALPSKLELSEEQQDQLKKLKEETTKPGGGGGIM